MIQPKMSEDSAAGMRELVESVYQSESRRVLATLIGLLGDFDLAEDALQVTFTAAVEQGQTKLDQPCLVDG